MEPNPKTFVAAADLIFLLPNNDARRSAFNSIGELLVERRFSADFVDEALHIIVRRLGELFEAEITAVSIGRH